MWQEMSKIILDFESIRAYMVLKVGGALSATAHMAKKNKKRGENMAVKGESNKNWNKM